MAVQNASYVYDPIVYQSMGVNPETYMQQFQYQKTGPTGTYYTFDPGPFATQNGKGFEAFQQAAERQFGSRYAFLQQQMKANPQAWNEYVKNPYQFQGNQPLQTAAQRTAAQQAQQAAQNKPAPTKPMAVQPYNPIMPKNPVATVNPGSIPSYIPTSPKPIINGLQSLMQNLGQYFDTSGMTSTVENQIQQNTSIGQQFANNAGLEYTNRAMLNGGDPSLAGVMRAQSMMPIYQQNSQVRSDLAGKVSQVQQNEAGARSTIASTIAQLKNSYLQSLQDYSGKLQTLQTTSELEREKIAQQQKQFDATQKLNWAKYESDAQAQTRDAQMRAAQMLQQIGPAFVTERTDWSRLDPWSGLSPTVKEVHNDDEETRRLRMLLGGITNG